MINVKNKNDLAIQLPLHEKWLRSEEGGERLVCSSGANLSGADLSGANLRRANLRRADLSGANLSGADLSGADLRRADLRRADLSGANLSGANLRRADLRRADLRRADLSGADLSGADLSGADLSGANLPVQTICKWSISVTEKEIRIGCKTKTATEWRKFFKSKEFVSTDPELNPVEYELIHLAFKQAVIAQKMLKLRSKVEA